SYVGTVNGAALFVTGISFYSQDKPPELYRTDGTAGGTVRLLTLRNDKTYFPVSRPPAASGLETTKLTFPSPDRWPPARSSISARPTRAVGGCGRATAPRPGRRRSATP